MVLGITSLSLVRGNRFVEMMMVLMAGRDAPKNPLFPPISEFVLDRIFEFVLDRTPCGIDSIDIDEYTGRRKDEIDFVWPSIRSVDDTWKHGMCRVTRGRWK